tara:strand:- start:189 stop:368 length:180 start_codon:yes stop_codon:yes gene_type:complete
MTKLAAISYFKTGLKIICLAVMLNVRFPLSLRNVEDLLHECGDEVEIKESGGVSGAIFM